MSKITAEILCKVISSIRKGEKITCPQCKVGNVVTDSAPETAHYLTCSNKNCDFELILD